MLRKLRFWGKQIIDSINFKMKQIIALLSFTLLISCSSQEEKQLSNKKEVSQINKSESPNQEIITRPLSMLIDTIDSGWEDVLEWKKSAVNKVEILPKEKLRADSELYYTQVTTRSPMGAIIYESGGILVDGGWIRILGSGHNKLDRTIMEWNKNKSYTEFGTPLSFLLIADDVLGGFFAINSGGIDSLNIGKVYYFAPETWEWSNLNMTYSEFIIFCFSGDLNTFYEGFRWINWEIDISNLNGNQGIFCFPYLTTVEGQDINKVQRNPVPIQELWDFTTTNK